jgi:hypothetical protein
VFILASPYALAVTACPSWCRLPAGHAPEVDVDGTAAVVHRAVVLADNPDGHRLDLVQRVTVGPDGTAAVAAPVVLVDGRADGGLTAEQTRRQAAALLWAVGALTTTLAGGAR